MDLNEVENEEVRSPADFSDAFEQWMKSVQRPRKGLREKSSEIAYAMMWHTFTKWCVASNVDLDTLTPENLVEFVSKPSERNSEKALSDRYVWRLLTLIDWVIEHRRKIQGKPDSVVVETVFRRHPDWRNANAGKHDPLPASLPPKEAARLVSYLSDARSRARVGEAVMPWREVRNRTAVALMLGAGLTPGEVRGLELKHVIGVGTQGSGVPWKLRVPPSGKNGMREAPMTGWAGRLLAHYLVIRTKERIPGAHLFPSTRRGSPWGKVAQYKATAQVLAAAGMDRDFVLGGSLRLRHTFALRQLRRGKLPDQVALWLGVELREVIRYNAVLDIEDDKPE